MKRQKRKVGVARQSQNNEVHPTTESGGCDQATESDWANGPVFLPEKKKKRERRKAKQTGTRKERGRKEKEVDA